jgi:hypothetical protein
MLPCVWTFRAGLKYVAMAGVLLMAGCASYSTKVEQLRTEYGAGSYAEAEAFVDEQLIEELGVQSGSISGARFEAGALDPSRGDVLLLLLEKSMLRLSQGDPESAVKLLRVARDQLDVNFQYDTGAFVGELSSMAGDDRMRDYVGADYDHIMVRVMLALCDLLAGDGDAYAYAVQVGEKQEEIIGSPLGEAAGREGYRPRESYSRVSLGSYLQGVVREDKFALDEAARAYERALAFEGGEHALYSEALDRAKSSGHTAEGRGALQVFYLAGRGPHLIASRYNPTERAVRLTGIFLLLLNRTTAVIGQSPVPVPMVVVNDPHVASLSISSVNGAGAVAKTQAVLDVNAVAQEQLDANMPLIAARALARRAIKAAVAHAAGKAAGKNSNNAQAVAGAVSLLLGAVTTIAEDADTRSWATLPAQIQSARLELPAGVNTVDFGGTSADIRISAGRDSYVLLMRPSLSEPPVVIIDRYSKALE